MLKNKRKTKNIKKKRKSDNTVLGFRHCFALRNQGNVSDAIALKNWVLSSIDGEIVNRMKIRSSA